MKRWLTVVVLAAGLLAVTAVPGHAWRGGWHGHPRFGVFVVGAPWPLWYYPSPYYVYAPPTVVVQQPPVYVQQPASPPAPPPPPPPPPTAAPAQASWYYCASAQAYYPAVTRCPEPWMQVSPRTE